MHAFEIEARPQCAALAALHVVLLEERIVEVLEGPPRRLGGAPVGVLRAANAVKVLEAPIVQQPVDLLAAVATELQGLLAPQERRRHIQVAVRAARGRGPPCFGWGADCGRVAHAPPPPFGRVAANDTRRLCTNRWPPLRASTLSSHRPGASRATNVR